MIRTPVTLSPGLATIVPTSPSIYGKLVPLLGDDNTNALMSEFPSVEAEQLVTKDFLRAELAELQNRLMVRVYAGLGAAVAILGTLDRLG